MSQKHFGLKKLKEGLAVIFLTLKLLVWMGRITGWKLKVLWTLKVKRNLKDLKNIILQRKSTL